ncbi:MAG: hypothetical protein LBS89_00405 [Zoogloeaceae bacterium]|nr:hypothetical protein [Zoogloeaceae bacterium]
MNTQPSEFAQRRIEGMESAAKQMPSWDFSASGEGAGTGSLRQIAVGGVESFAKELMV